MLYCYTCTWWVHTHFFVVSEVFWWLCCECVVGSRLCCSGCMTPPGLRPWNRVLRQATWVRMLRPHVNTGCSCRPRHTCTVWRRSCGTVMSCQWTTTCPDCSTESFSSESTQINTLSFCGLAVQIVQVKVLDECIIMPKVCFGTLHLERLRVEIFRSYFPALFYISSSLQVWILYTYQVEQSETTFAVYVEQIQLWRPLTHSCALINHEVVFELLIQELLLFLHLSQVVVQLVHVFAL